jgi:hypothetical protein
MAKSVISGGAAVYIAYRKNLQVMYRLIMDR